MAEVTQKVQAHEPDTLLYYAFTNEQNKEEIIVVERYQLFLPLSKLLVPVWLVY